MIKYENFEREFTPRSSEKVVAQRLGRNATWVKTQQKRLVPKDSLVQKRTTLMSKYIEVSGKNSRILKHVSKGCEYKCGGSGEMVTCPSCKRFRYHIECLESMCEFRNKTCPDLTQEDWKCPHC